MGAVNGFTLTAPDTVWTEVTTTQPYSDVYAAKFPMPCSGTIRILEIGMYGLDSGDVFHLAIFTHDATNGTPETMVTGTETDNIATTASLAKCKHTYSSAPEIDCGDGTGYLWIASKVKIDNAIALSRAMSGGTLVSLGGQSNYSGPFPSGDAWHTANTYDRDASYYAVYEVVSTGQFARPAYYYAQQ
jgi:hypothetical protein